MVREAPPGGDGAQNSSSGTDIFCESQFLTSTAVKQVQVGRPLLIPIQHVLNYCQVLHPQGATFSGIEARTLVDNLVQI